MNIHTPSAVSCDSVASKPMTAARDGFFLNAAVACQARQRAKLERLCRYMSRPPIALQRLSLDGDGLVVYGRVRGRPRDLPLPSEPSVRLSPHSAQALKRRREAPGEQVAAAQTTHRDAIHSGQSRGSGLSRAERR